MTDPSEDLLITTEGVDEGSAASTDEGPRDGSPAAGTVTAPADPESQPAAPLVVETEESREATGPGQQLAEGEG